MKRLFLTLTVILLSTVVLAGSDDIMITRDGMMLKVKILRISQSQVVFYDLKHKRKGEMKAPADYIYMIWKEKGSSIHFDEEGNQITQPSKKIDDKETTLFLNDGKYFTVYNLSVGKDEMTYQLKDKKKAPYYKSTKNEAFMVLNNDGTVTLYNNDYIEKHSKRTAPAPQPAVPTQTAPQAAAAPASSGLLASPPPMKTSFNPAPDMSPAELEMKVNAIQPYTLFRKGSMAEYIIMSNGKQGQFLGGPTYVQQVVQEEKIENGLLVAYVQQMLFNKKHEPSKGVSAKYKAYYYPTEIDTAGNYHLTHDISRDFMFLSKRNGYAMVVPGTVKVGDRLDCSTINDDAKNMFGGSIKVKAVYSDFVVAGEEEVATPAGTFNCIKLTGNVMDEMPRAQNYNYTWWLARGIGFVKYEIRPVDGKSTTTILLNKVEQK